MSKCIYCGEGFGFEEIQGHEGGVWHPRCVPPTPKIDT